MIDDKKMEKIKKSCMETARKELIILKQENDSFSNEQINQMIDFYKEELANRYSNELNKIEREYNKDLFDFEMEERMRVNKFKKSLKDNIKSEVINELKKFVSSKEYEYYLIENINSVLKKIKYSNNCLICITEKDYEKYNDILKSKFNLKVEKMDDDNIGGVIIIDENSKISIDNTIKNSVEEKMNAVKF